MTHKSIFNPISSPFALAALLALFSSQTACAHKTTIKKTDALKSSSSQVIAPNLREDPWVALEQELSKVRTERVTVSTALLRSLVLNQRQRQTHCKNISGQLEAIKSIDMKDLETNPLQEEPNGEPRE